MKTLAMRLFLFVVAGTVLVLSSSAGANAPAGRYTVSTNTVYDNKTKLTWQRAVPSATYTWSNAKAYCASSTVSSTLGGSGWRLPTVKELLTLEDYSQNPGIGVPQIDANAFPGTPMGNFWSATPQADYIGASSIGAAYFVGFGGYGHAYIDATSSLYYVRCVR